MYELIQAAERTYYIQCPAKMGVWKLSETDAVLIDSGNDKDAGKKVQKIFDAQGWRLSCILTLNYREVIEREAYYDSSLLSDSGNTIRDGKNSVIVFIALCCRAAIEGGLSGRTAKEIEHRYCTEIEKCTTVTKMKNVCRQMLDEVCKKVHSLKEQPMISKPTRQACDYIRSNVKHELSVEEIAKVVGYTPYYFNRKFYTEMGIRVGDYIKRARCEYAKVELLTTDKSIQDISDSLHFGTRNYFSRVFREIVGVTPAAYREQTERH